MKVIVRWSRDREDLEDDPTPPPAAVENGLPESKAEESSSAIEVAQIALEPCEAAAAAAPAKELPVTEATSPPPVTVTMATAPAIEMPAEPILSALDPPPLFPPTTAK